ncbi:hypothetical protein Tco_0381579 [Tanacetum coccineum]
MSLFRLFVLNPIYAIKYRVCWKFFHFKLAGLVRKKGVPKTRFSVPKRPRNCERLPRTLAESSDDNTIRVNAPREPIVVNQDPGENSSPSPPHIVPLLSTDVAVDSLERSFFCRLCTVLVLWE